MSLNPYIDTVSPVIENAFDISKFAFCTNETSDYLYPDSLYGDIDIIIKAVDIAADSPWEQPVYESYYWLTNLPEGDTIFARTLGQRLNHPYSFYSSESYQPYVALIYKSDDVFEAPGWMNEQRDYYHILTNNNGDSVAALEEQSLAFRTADYHDGYYRIFVEVFDECGNSDIDSMDVRFVNGISDIKESEKCLPERFQLKQNYPNPFNQSTIIEYSLTEIAEVNIANYDILGRWVETLVNNVQAAGNYQITWNAANYSTGLYFYQIKAGDYCDTRKMFLLK